MSATMPPASTPCVRLCTVDAAAGLCTGCGRTLAEIGAWGGLAEPERQRIMATLPGRLRRLRLSSAAAG